LWDSSRALNPLTSSSPANLQLAGLLYEGLFRVNNDFTWEPVLCDTWETTDGMHWSFRLKSGILFHNGSELGIFDVIGTLNTARETGRYVNRLSNVSKVGTADGAVTVTLKIADYDFPALLDIPIMKDGTTYSQRPLGTGPFTLDAGTNTLRAYFGHRSAEDLPIMSISLTEVEHENLIPAFDSGTVDMIIENKSDTGSMEYSAGAERRGYATNIMHFVGFNPWRGYCMSPEHRKVIASIFNRAALTAQSLPDCKAAVLPLPPGSPYYLQSIADTALIPAASIRSTMAAVGTYDYDGDGVLDYYDDDGVMHKASLEFVVHRDNLKKVNAAKQLADMLREYGFTVVLRELSWSDYSTAVKEGRFDLFYGSVQISANFNLMPLFDDKGAARSVSYNSTLDLMATEFLAASPGEMKQTAAFLLLTEFCDYLPFTPVVFESGALLTNRGVVTGANPTQYNAFNDFTQWKINFGG
jgi:peptide/nickel transport system substrate-binding protein